MIALLQRVSRSKVTVDGETVGEIGLGYNILLGVLKEDDEADIEKLVQKIVNLRVFADENGKMNKNILDVKGEALVVSQFTLAGNVKKGRRPSFDNAMPPDEAKRLYEEFCLQLGKHIEVQTGKFGAMMEVEIINDGPVTFIIDSKEL
ncbi:D-aminoacyl-tRNA deacylase [Hydrogenimonas thermophila]|uniref:D-aminoacyl-tRNA deacylase n=1 Tax=Hydrogenimonas thermophila TaxID=223786 RepID=A0A1I5PWT7_9BACT|nr:D-aminoacyl-tRNA deacylase [Hydrogenimonas thermophila]WOE68811.1 D-aminoacyl-tRNA deacylase [Hydrogenimonas thermophila]WOE71321.1 D-aminoacyl-tRNA deacylase [Hydrogenimonas thermophila]SFP38444.1 D-tyrosyl-tRNA(Tyr) deacylase [Hydrogenimonas thermophila]